MKLSESIKPISYLKAHASELIREVSDNGKTYVITQNGEAKAVLLDVNEYEKNQETMAMLKILSLGEEDLKKGNYKDIDVFYKDFQKFKKDFKKR